MEKVVIIGGGASGLIAALKLAEKKEVLLLEKNDKLAKKILATGNGHCNYWNKNINVDKYYTDSIENLNKIITPENQNNTFDFLSFLGIYPVIKNDLYYPYSYEALTVTNILEKKVLENKNIKVKLNYEVNSIEKENDIFVINKDIKCEKLIIASGSHAYLKKPNNIYKLVNNLGIKINEVKPALTSLICKENFLKELHGVRVDGMVSLYIENEKVKEEKGQIQFTDYGLSGICIFNLSSLVSKNLNKKIEIKINLFPDIDIKNVIESQIKVLKDLNIYNILNSLVNHKLLNVILKICNINKETNYNDLSKEKINLLINSLINLTFNVKNISGFITSQTSTGGVTLKCINPENMESSIKNLYFTGEILDADGICGGFNLAFAFITGYIVGSKI